MKDKGKKALNVLCLGYSEGKLFDKKIFFKHFGLEDLGKVDRIEEEAGEDAEKKGLKSEKEALESLAKRGEWTQEEEAEIPTLRKELEMLRFTGERLLLREHINKNKEEQDEIIKKRKLKELIRAQKVGLTVESFASKRAEEYFIFLSSFSDASLQAPFFSLEEFLDLDREQMEALMGEYNSKILFAVEGIKDAAFSPSFINLISLSSDPYSVFGKALVHLTNYQTELLHWGKRYQQILSSSDKIPREALKDHESLEKWRTATENARETLDGLSAKSKGNEDGVEMASIVGMSKEEVESSGIQKSQTISLAGELKKKGGMNKEEMMAAGLI